MMTLNLVKLKTPSFATRSSRPSSTWLMIERKLFSYIFLNKINILKFFDLETYH